MPPHNDRERERAQRARRITRTAPEIHESLPSRGCVTVVRWTFSRERDIATSLYKDTLQWVSAEPRPATLDEIYHFTNLALDNWNG